jgi:hypothetical protein
MVTGGDAGIFKNPGVVNFRVYFELEGARPAPPFRGDSLEQKCSEATDGLGSEGPCTKRNHSSFRPHPTFGGQARE